MVKIMRKFIFILHRTPLKSKNTIAKFNERKNKLSKLKTIQETNLKKYKEILSSAKLLKSFVEKHKIRASLFEKSPMSLIKVIFIMLLMITFLPIHLMTLFTNYIPYKIPVWFVEKKIKDKHFHGSLKQALGVVVFIGYWSIILLLLTLIIFGWMYTVLIAILFPVLNLTLITGFKL